MIDAKLSHPQNSLLVWVVEMPCPNPLPQVLDSAPTYQNLRFIVILIYYPYTMRLPCWNVQFGRFISKLMSSAISFRKFTLEVKTSNYLVTFNSVISSSVHSPHHSCIFMVTLRMKCFTIWVTESKRCTVINTCIILFRWILISKRLLGSFVRLFLSSYRR